MEKKNWFVEADSSQAVKIAATSFIAGGASLVDLTKLNVERPQSW
jgi:CO/xanthine dehydrogenase FAD-binding subunit